jgi:hypothetical protein
MQPAAFLSLKKLSELFPFDFGKICQGLAALAFRATGFTHVVCRLSEGVDIDLDGQFGKFAVEVKTTHGEEIELAPKDISGLAARKHDGYEPLVAALRIGFLADWVLARASSLPPSHIRLERLKLLALGDLQAELQGNFAEVLVRLSGEIISEHADSPLAFLRTRLEAEKIQTPD